MAAVTKAGTQAVLAASGVLTGDVIMSGIITTASLRADRVLHTWRTCVACSMPIRIMIFRGTGFCSERCAKEAACTPF